jgi:hypothetical protein
VTYHGCRVDTEGFKLVDEGDLECC